MLAAGILCGAASVAAQEAAPPSHGGGLWQRDALAGDWGGARDRLEGAGIRLGASSIDEALGNASGGVRQGVVYEGRLELSATIDLAKAVAWDGATLHANAYQIRGRGLGADKLGSNLLPPSNIEATRATRLFDLWLEQGLANGAFSLRVGQLAADDEFFISDYAGSFVNSTFGWPAILATDLPSGGPAYPLATPGMRLKLRADEGLSFQAAVFNGDPAGPGSGDPQRRNASGTAFRLGDDAFVIAEAALAINQAKDAAGPPATHRLGGWFHSGSFADQRFDASGQSLAAPTSTGAARAHRHDYGPYVAIDQGLWREGERELGVFLRGAAAPSDRNLVALYGDLGVAAKGVIARGDVLGIAVAVARIGDRARARDGDRRSLTGGAGLVRDGEAVLEITYRWPLAPWWSLQPDLQYIIHPGGRVALPDDPSGVRAIPDALVLALRSSVTF
jgi:porin